MVCVRVCVMCARAVLGVSGAYPIYLSVHILSTPYPCIYTDQPLRAHQHVLVHHLAARTQTLTVPLTVPLP